MQYQSDIFLAANMIRKLAVGVWPSRLTPDHFQFFCFDLINSILGPGQAAWRETQGLRTQVSGNLRIVFWFLWKPDRQDLVAIDARTSRGSYDREQRPLLSSRPSPR
jgi:hypothetical protein